MSKMCNVIKPLLRWISWTKKNIPQNWLIFCWYEPNFALMVVMKFDPQQREFQLQRSIPHKSHTEKSPPHFWAVVHIYISLAKMFLPTELLLRRFRRDIIKTSLNVLESRIIAWNLTESVERSGMRTSKVCCVDLRWEHFFFIEFGYFLLIGDD